MRFLCTCILEVYNSLFMNKHHVMFGQFERRDGGFNDVLKVESGSASFYDWTCSLACKESNTKELECVLMNTIMHSSKFQNLSIFHGTSLSIIAIIGWLLHIGDFI